MTISFACLSYFSNRLKYKNQGKNMCRSLTGCDGFDMQQNSQDYILILNERHNEAARMGTPNARSLKEKENGIGGNK